MHVREGHTLDVAQTLADARGLVRAQARAIQALTTCLDGRFVDCLARLKACRGHIVVTGMGKSGLVAQKISATFASTGAPSLFMHAAEAVHGDLGRLRADDVVLALSNSGESAELVRLIAPIRARGTDLLALTGRADSTLGRAADVTIAIGEMVETCPMGLVPTTSTTAMLVVGDALAMGLFRIRGLGTETYAQNHPGGALGRKLMQVHEVMRRGDANPLAYHHMSLREVIAVMTRTPGRPGAACIVDTAGRVAGFFTDGDLRRLLGDGHVAIDAPIHAVMSRHPKVVHPNTLVAAAVQFLVAHRIDQMPVVNDDGAPVGLLDVQDVLHLREGDAR